MVAQLEVSVGDAPDAFNDDPAEVVQVPSSDDGGGEPEASIGEVADVPGAPDYASRIHAELCVLSTSCRGDWELMQAVPIVYDGEAASSGAGEGARLMLDRQTDAAVPAGDRFLCFVDYLRGVLLCDTAADMGTLRYVPLPVEAPDHVWRDDLHRVRRTRSLSAAAGAVRFVSVAPRCCCGGPGRT